jgi:hypothetical protein
LTLTPSRSAKASREGPRARRLALGLAGGFVLLHPLLYLQAYLGQALADGWTNEALFGVRELIRAHRRPEEPVTLDQQLKTYVRGRGGNAARSLELVLAIDRVPWRLADLRPGRELDPDLRCRDQLVVLDRNTSDRNRKIVDALNLRELGRAEPSAVGRGDGYLVYRLQRPEIGPAAEPRGAPCP